MIGDRTPVSFDVLLPVCGTTCTQYERHQDADDPGVSYCSVCHALIGKPTRFQPEEPDAPQTD
jgi:hypothetical protein